jgi:serine/threonine protein kinase
MPAATADELLSQLRKSELVPPARLDAWLDENPTPFAEPPHGLAQRLVAAGLLTPFQADLLLQGRAGDALIAGKYKVLDLLGKGGMGAVYLCEHLALRTFVAVKVLPASAEVDPEARARFYREARAFATLNHPNLVRGFDVDTDGSRHFIVMEYVDGVDLQALVTRCGPLAVGRAVNYARQAATGLAHAHDRGWVHRDIKPANLAVDRAGVVRVLDMGLARIVLEGNDSITRNFDDGNIRGTADYLAPEQASGALVDGRADFYSLGVTLYFLLTARLPFEEVNTAQKLVAHIIKNPHPIALLRPELPPELARVVERMLAKDPAQRYQTGLEVAEALAPWDGGPCPPTEPEVPRRLPGGPTVILSSSGPATPLPHPGQLPPTEVIARPGKRPRTLLLAAGLTAAAICGIALIVASMLKQPPPRPEGPPHEAPTVSPFLGHYVPVTRNHGPNQAAFPGGHSEYLLGRVYSTVAEALKDPRLRQDDNCRILLLDEIHEEQVEVDAGALPHGISIESARVNPPTQWIPPEHADPARPMLLVTGGSRVAVRNLTFNGMGRLENPVAWRRPGPGCQLHDVRVTKFTRLGVSLAARSVEAADPVQLSRVRISPESGAPVDACVAVSAPAGEPTRNLRLTECRLEGPAADGVLLTGGVEGLEVVRCRLFSLQTGVRFAGPGRLQAVLQSNTTARVTVPVRIDAPPPAGDKGARLLLRSNLFYGASGVVRFAEPGTARAELFSGSEANWCEVGGCPAPTPGVPVSHAPDLLLGLDPEKDRSFLRYAPQSPLATAGPGGQPVGVPP